jgi:hypothetical protein
MTETVTASLFALLTAVSLETRAAESVDTGMTARTVSTNASVATNRVSGTAPAQKFSITNHPVLGRWTAPIDGKPGFVREFRADGGVSVWWPNGKLAATGTFFIVGDVLIGARYPDGATDTVKLMGPDEIQIDRVQPPGYFRRYFAERVR